MVMSCFVGNTRLDWEVATPKEYNSVDVVSDKGNALLLKLVNLGVLASGGSLSRL